MNQLIETHAKAPSPSEFAINAAYTDGTLTDKPRLTYRAKRLCNCALCGKWIEEQEPAELNLNFVSKVGSAFNDGMYMAHPESPVICQYCVEISNPIFLSIGGSSVITEDGLYGFSNAADISWWVLHMRDFLKGKSTNQDKPFMMQMKKSAMLSQHTIWRTPINYSCEQFTLRHSNNLYQVNLARLLNAFESISQSDHYRWQSDADKAAGKPTLYRHPFQSMDVFSINDIQIGARHGACEYTDKEDGMVKVNDNALSLMRGLGDLSQGELFLLGMLFSASADPVKWNDVLTRTEPNSLSDMKEKSRLGKIARMSA